MGIVTKLRTGESGSIHAIASTAYGVCSSAISSNPKAVVFDDWTMTTINKGMTIFIKFVNGNSFNINDTFEMTFSHAVTGTWIASTSVVSHSADDLYIAPGSIVGMTYDGTNWVLNDRLRFQNNDFGFGATYTDTAKSTLAKTAQLLGYRLEEGGMVLVRFIYDVLANSTLNINSQGAIPLYYKGSAITDNVIRAGERALLMYDVVTGGTNRYHVISVDNTSKNIKDGSGTGSARMVGTTEEDSDYSMGNYAFAEGRLTKASGSNAHAEGANTLASGTDAHAEGDNTEASGARSHAEGNLTKATGQCSHSQNEGTRATMRAQTVIGTYNVEDSAPSTAVHPGGGTYYGNYALICGNGTGNSSRSNAFTIDWLGNYVGGSINGYTLAAACAKSVDSSITSGSASSNLPTSAAVANFVASQISNVATFQGTVNAGTEISSLTDYTAGWYWVVQTADTYAGVVCTPGDMIFCVNDYSGSYSASDFEVVSAGLDMAALTTSEIDELLV